MRESDQLRETCDGRVQRVCVRLRREVGCVLFVTGQNPIRTVRVGIGFDASEPTNGSGLEWPSWASLLLVGPVGPNRKEKQEECFSNSLLLTF